MELHSTTFVLSFFNN